MDINQKGLYHSIQTFFDYNLNNLFFYSNHQILSILKDLSQFLSG